MKKTLKKKDIIINPDYWVLPNRKKMVEWIDDTFKNKWNTKSDYFSHQEFIRNYFQIKSPYRGILLYHSLGSGKSCSSILIAESFRNIRKVMVFLPASLEKNYIKELKKCGHPKYNIEKHYWKRKEIETGKTKKKIKIVWEIIEDKKSNINDLSEEDIKDIHNQINNEIKKDYEFIHYNGLSKKKILDFENEDYYFDNKLIIVDEVHNFISMIVGSGEIGIRLYTLFMNCKNTRFVFLSGTPIINYAFELCYLFNILRGYITTYTITLNNYDNDEEMVEFLSKKPLIDQIFSDYKNSNVILTENQTFFENYYVNNEYMGVKYNDTLHPDLNFKKYLYSIFRDKKYEIKSIKINKYTCLPEDEDEFNKTFLTKNDILFKKRILGLVSYFKNQDTENIPSIKKEHTIKCLMSDFQTHVYKQMRTYEMEKEKMLTKKKNDKDSNSVFRVFSRQCCNFIFPEEMKRPFPSNGKKDNIDEFIDENDLRSKRKTEFQLQKELVFIQLKKEKYDYLTLDKLDRYSNKFKHILLNINESPGTCFVYSQFRKLEGIGIFSLVLEANGYNELKVNKNELNEWEISEDCLNKPCFSFYTGEESIEKREFIKDIFNNDMSNKQFKDRDNLYGSILKVLLVTSSAAEGINLKNVRQVHIIEPYWNPIRIEQVKGRAIRYGSHMELPVDERNVEIFEYESCLDRKNIEDSKHIIKRDKGLSTDEIIKDIANKKRDINNTFLKYIKESSIDCNIHNHGEEQLNCIHFGDYYSPYAYHPNINLDENNSNFITSKGVIIKYKNKNYIWNKDKNEVYDFEDYKKGRPKKIGMIKENKILFDNKK